MSTDVQTPFLATPLVPLNVREGLGTRRDACADDGAEFYESGKGVINHINNVIYSFHIMITTVIILIIIIIIITVLLLLLLLLLLLSLLWEASPPRQSRCPTPPTWGRPPSWLQTKRRRSVLFVGRLRIQDPRVRFPRTFSFLTYPFIALHLSIISASIIRRFF